jgi:hypothetical protein
MSVKIKIDVLEFNVKKMAELKEELERSKKKALADVLNKKKTLADVLLGEGGQDDHKIELPKELCTWLWCSSSQAVEGIAEGPWQGD